MQVDTVISIVTWIVTGAIAGYIASLLLRAERMGCFVNIGLGIAGAFVGGFLVNLLLPGLNFQGGAIVGFFNALFHAVFGAVILLVLAEIILPGKQLGVRGEERKRRKRR